ncbi:MAG: hypothetical protein ACI945_000428 [Pseudohongiellaceae bacterium]
MLMSGSSQSCLSLTKLNVFVSVVALYTAAAPPEISESSWVIAACRALL